MISGVKMDPMRKPLRPLGLGLLLAALLPAAYGVTAARAATLDQLAAASETGTFVDPDHPETPFPYRLFRPPAIEPGRRYPLVVFLHGNTWQGADNRRHLTEMTGSTFFDRATQARHPAFIVAPQLPDAALSWGPDNAAVIQWPTHTPVKLVDFLAANHPIDERRLYLTGASMGGRATRAIAALYPKKFAAVFPGSGPADLTTAPLLAALGPPFWSFQNTYDPTNPPCGPRSPGAKVNNPRDLAQAMAAAGAAMIYTEANVPTPAGCAPLPAQTSRRLPTAADRFAYTEYNVAQHDCWTRAYNEPALLAWVFAQALPDPAPGDGGAAPDADDGGGADAAGGQGGRGGGGASGGEGGDGGGGNQGAGGAGGSPLPGDPAGRTPPARGGCAMARVPERTPISGAALPWLALLGLRATRAAARGRRTGQRPP